MIFRPATEQDINWVRQNLRESARREFTQSGRSLEEVWQAHLSREDAQWSAFVDDQGECVAVMVLCTVTEEFRPNTGFGVLFTTAKVEEEQVGFLRAVRQWLASAYQGKPYDEIWTWVDEKNIKSYNMITRFLGFEREETVQPEQPGLPAQHLVFHRRQWLAGKKPGHKSQKRAMGGFGGPGGPEA